MDFRDNQQLRVDKIAAKLRGVGGFAHEIKLVTQIFPKLGDHLAWL